MSAVLTLAGTDRRRALLLVWLAVAAAAAVAAVGVTLAGGEHHPGLVALGRAAMIGIPIAVGGYARYRRPNERFGKLMVGVGVVVLLTTLAESRSPGLYTAGRAMGWLAEFLIAYLILSFPTGRLATRVDRLLVGAMAIVVLTLFVPYLALAAEFPLPSPWTSCVRDCPTNPLFVFDREPAVVGAVIEPLGALLVVAVMIGVSARLWRRIWSGSSMANRMFAPLFVVATVRPALLAVGIWVRHADPLAPALQVVAWLLALAV